MLVDHDQVELSNLHRQTCYTMNDLGRDKVDALARRIALRNPEVRVERHVLRADMQNAADLAQECDVLVDGVDDFELKLQLADVAARQGIAFIFGGASGWLAVVSTVLPRQSPCLRCHFQEQKPPPPEGILAPLPGATGSLQACEAVKILTGIGEPITEKLLLCNMLEGTVLQKPLASWDACPSCAAMRPGRYAAR